ncbi:hypothetical protein [Streptomyces sp. NPDC001500]
MPLIRVTLLEGRSPQEVAALGEALTAALSTPARFSSRRPMTVSSSVPFTL